MNLASLFNLAGPDLFVILIIVLLLFGARQLPNLRKPEDQLEEPEKDSRLAAVNRLLIPIALVIFALAAWVWLSGR